jgi:predicted Fe-Mo cluster-binding NifX family protein
MQVAIVSTDGINVDDHFGRAERFLIYEISGNSQALTAIKIAAPLSDGDPDHKFNPDRFSEITAKLTGCERLYCTRIGDRPAAELKRLGIESVIYAGQIKSITV